MCQTLITNIVSFLYVNSSCIPQLYHYIHSSLSDQIKEALAVVTKIRGRTSSGNDFPLLFDYWFDKKNMIDMWWSHLVLHIYQRDWYNFIVSRLDFYEWACVPHKSNLDYRIDIYFQFIHIAVTFALLQAVQLENEQWYPWWSRRYGSCFTSFTILWSSYYWITVRVADL